MTTLKNQSDNRTQWAKSQKKQYEGVRFC